LSQRHGIWERKQRQEYFDQIELECQMLRQQSEFLWQMAADLQTGVTNLEQAPNMPEEIVLLFFFSGAQSPSYVAAAP
jgi:hypothetical protein